MEFTILSYLLVLIQLISVIIVVAYLLTRSRIFSEVLDGHPAVKTQVILILVFGALSVYGTISGIEFMGAIVNVRDLGPMLAGLLGGPVVGIGAGLIGAAYRLSLEGFTVYACSLATVLAGLFGGIIWLACRRQVCRYNHRGAFCHPHGGLPHDSGTRLCRPFDQAVIVVSAVALPIILANAAGMFVFAFIVRISRTSERCRQSGTPCFARWNVKTPNWPLPRRSRRVSFLIPSPRSRDTTSPREVSWQKR